MMKKLTLFFMGVIGWNMSIAQTEISDSVILGRGYVNQVFYDLKDGEVKSDTNVIWDLAFNASSRGGNIRTNGAFGVKLYTYPLGDTAAWSTIDTSTIATWKPKFNSDTSWYVGAFDNHVKSDPYDIGWGMYDINTHIVTGDSVYVIEFADKSLKKLWIERLRGGRYFVRYANIDGTEDSKEVVDKFDYENKNFGYFSMRNKTQMDREPVSGAWDLSFHRYITKLQGGVDYPVVGVLANEGVTVSEARNVDIDTTKYDDFPYDTKINTMGHDWKTFSMDCSCYQIEDSLAYFVKDLNGMIYRIVFTGFSGTEAGIVKFNKLWIDTTTGIEDEKKGTPFFALVPNPVGENKRTEIVYDFAKSYQNARLVITDLSGKEILNKNVSSQEGLNSYYFDGKEMNKGIYLVSLVYDTGVLSKKLVIQ